MLPRAIAAALQLPELEPGAFTATKFSTKEEKAKFGNHLLRFIAEDYPRGLWTKNFYNRLSMTFSNIAHYDSAGFWMTWFDTTADQIGFLKNIAQCPCWGDPTFTYSDVEKVIKARVRTAGVIEWKKRLLAEERKRKDLAELTRLKRLYGEQSAEPTAILPSALSPSMTQVDLFS